jgi:dephospho-CoA kinase
MAPLSREVFCSLSKGVRRQKDAEEGRQMLNVGLTGGVASGKSAAARMLEALGARRVDADRIAHGLLNKGQPEAARVLKHFGPGVRASGNGVDRARLRQTVLARPSEMRFLERVVHPGVGRELRRIMARTRLKKGVLVIEVPLLFECGMDKWMDVNVCVAAPATKRAANAARKGMRAADWRRFSALQWPQARKVRKADRVIRNDGTLKEFRKKITVLYKELVKGGI